MAHFAFRSAPYPSPIARASCCGALNPCSLQQEEKKLLRRPLSAPLGFPVPR